MKISILLPYKENFSPEYAGAVSIFIKDTVEKSKYKKNITVFGNTSNKQIYNINYKNLNFKKTILKSSSKSYIQEFLKIEKREKSNIIEFHNRPTYLKYLLNLNYAKKVLYFHNDPLDMNGSRKNEERIYLIDNLDKIIFNSEWSKSRFIKNLSPIYKNSPKLITIKQSIDKKKINLNKKEKIITFVGKLNSAKGYDIFGRAIIPILNKYKDWSSYVVGDEPREKITFNHPKLKLLGFQKHPNVLKILEKSSIAVVCSRWNEPFGRVSLEAASRGCAVIISDRGGLKETITDGIVIKKINATNFQREIEKLINDKKLMSHFQSNSIKNFYLTNKFASNNIDVYRKEFLHQKTNKYIIKNIKILHITNLNQRHNGRLFYNTGRRINNGLIKLNHKVLTLSDRDMLSSYRSIRDFSGSKKLNNTLIETVRNFKPDLILLGHADAIKTESLKIIKDEFPNIKISQWFLDRMDQNWKKNKLRFLHKINFMDHSFCTTDPKSLNFNEKYKISFIPNPVDESIDDLKVFKNKNAKYDLFFAMSHGVHRGVLKKGKFDERENIINNLIKKNPHLKFNIFGMSNKQPIWGDDFKNNLNNSKIALNLSQGKPLKYYSSDRIAQLMGNGIATLIDEKTKINELFSNDCAIFYKSLDDLNLKINKLVKNDKLRNKIAKNGRSKYHKMYNSTKIADFIICKTFDIKKKFFWDKF
ncbi:glycosyltransferase [Candidatus Pelagibacter sp. HIMB1593]|uniref:glycosyltransferase n=1 Tax=Candidatus Pelagibacter sp. HIMB1593 TaxID=3413355 RepID=UPI003F84EB12